jgi:hypothetical protein
MSTAEKPMFSPSLKQRTEALSACAHAFPSINVVEPDMDNWRDEVAIVKAQLAVQHMALRALVHSHPQPAALLEQWRKLRADRVVAAYSLPADVRSSEWLAEHVHAFAEDWTAELVDAVARQDRGDGLPSGPDVTAT